MTPAERFATALVARLATVGTDGAPHVVPVTFAVDGDRIVTAIDHKPKRTLRLRRLDNIRAEPRVAVLADHYEADWGRLWWVRADGVAEILDGGGAGHAAAARLLADRYPAYRDRPISGPIIDIRVTRWSEWSAATR